MAIAAKAGDPLELVAVQEEAPGAYLGTCMDGAIGRVFGGQALAQAVRAASLGVGDRRPVESVHASFVNPACPAVPLRYRTEVVKSGRSLDVVGVRAEQGGRTMIHAFVATYEPEVSFEYVGVSAPAVRGPETLPADARVPPGTNADVRAPFDLRYVPLPDGAAPAREDLWLRTRADVSSDAQVDHAALLAYAVDFLVTRSAHAGLPPSLAIVGASLDHAMWFHRPFRVDRWLLVSSSCSVFVGSRALSTCHVFDRDGTLVATATQEALIRPAVPDVA